MNNSRLIRKREVPTLGEIAERLEIIHTTDNKTERSVLLYFNIYGDLIQYAQTIENIVYVFNLLRY